MVTTVEGELVPRTDTTGYARRKQKSYADILGRTFQTETFEWDGSTVFSANKIWFNGRDQVIRSRQYAGDISATVYQDTTATFDGHGRIVQSHQPEQMDSSENPTYSSVTYYPDDQAYIRTDARGATTTFTYNSVGRVANRESVWSGAPGPIRTNFALFNSGSSHTASSTHSSDNFPISGAFDGDRVGQEWGDGGGWNDNTQNAYPDWLEVEFPDEKPVDQINVFTLQDNYQNASEPTESTTFTQEGITAFDLEYWDGDSWEAISGTSVTGNNKVWRKFEFSPISTKKIRIVVNDSLSPSYKYSRVVELEVWGNDVLPATNTETSYSYDDLGNPLSMTDDQGGVVYEYDALSRIIAETRNFNDTMAHAPETGNGFKLEYTYNLAGSLKTLTDPFGEEFTYERDAIGRQLSIGGSSFDSVTTYTHDAEYTASGALKSAAFVGGTSMTIGHDIRGKVESFGLQKSNNAWIMNKAYDFYADGKMRFLDDITNAKFDRLNKYDYTGQIVEALSGGEARGETVAANDRDTDLPYRQGFEYNAFGQLVSTTSMHWGETHWNSYPFGQTFTFENNRIQRYGTIYDEDGRTLLTTSDSGDTTRTRFDSLGRQIAAVIFDSDANADGPKTRTYYDGNSKTIKKTSIKSTSSLLNPDGNWAQETKYYIRSSALGGKLISEAWSNGRKHRTYLALGGGQTAVQTEYTNPDATASESVMVEYRDPFGVSTRTVNKSEGSVASGFGGEGAPIETDPLGGSVGLTSPYIFSGIGYSRDPSFTHLAAFAIEPRQQMLGQDFARLYETFGSRIADLPGFGTNWGRLGELGERLYDESVWNATHGWGFRPNEFFGATPGSRITSLTPRYGSLDDSDSEEDDDLSVETNWGVVGWDVEETDEADLMSVASGLLDFLLKVVQAYDKQLSCDKRIAKIFGGPGAEVATRWDLNIQLRTFKGKTNDRSEHLYLSGVFHIYTDFKGSSEKEVGLFIPNGATFVPPSRETKGEYKDPINGEWKNEFVFRYKSGPYKGVSLHLVHVAGTYGGDYGGKFLGQQFINSGGQLIGAQNESKTSTQIGFIGGLAGEGPEGMSRHTHIVVKKNGVRVDPRKIFCDW